LAVGAVKLLSQGVPVGVAAVPNAPVASVVA